MEKKNSIALGVLTFFSLAGVVGGLLFQTVPTSLSLFRASGSEYTIELTSNKITTATSGSSTEVTKNFNTTSGNVFTLGAKNIVNYSSGWQTVLPGGCFYNPLNNSSDHNKLSGIKSIKFDSNTSCELSLHYGSSINNSEVIYTHAKNLTSGVAYNLTDEHPNYFYIKNDGASNVNITKFTVTYSCSDSGYSKSNYKVLMIGNSFADDTIRYAKSIANSYGINLDMYDAYIASCTINTHYSNLSSNASSYAMKNSVLNGEMNSVSGKTLTQILNEKAWDVVTFQQASSDVGTASSFSNLGTFVSSVRSIVGSTPKFYWHQTWAYDKDYADSGTNFSKHGNDQTTMYNAINSCYSSQVAPLGVFDGLIPAGTAVQNVRSSYMKDTITRDGKHMSRIHGRYLLGLDAFSSIFDVDLDLSPCSYVPNEVNDSYLNICKEAIRNAIKAPLSCTASAYQNLELGNHNLNNYIEIDAELIGCSYWNSTSSTSYNKRINHDSSTSNKFVSTKQFTQSTLPVGSFVVVGEAFGVRPEAWTNDAQQSTRPDVRYDNIIEIDSNFWSGYQYRAFNIFKEDGVALSGSDIQSQYSQIFDTFHVYVPSSSGLTPKETNDTYSADSALFTSNDVNINDYRRLQLDPITGFYKCDSYYYTMNSFVDSTAQCFVCTRPFFTANEDLPQNTVIIVDSNYQWRSDCWGANGTHSRPNNVTTNFTILDSSFMSEYRTRTFNISKINLPSIVDQYLETMSHFRIYVPISNAPVAVSGVRISNTSLSLSPGATYQLTATVLPATAQNKSVTWSSSNTSVATVSSTGLVTAVSEGSVTITVATVDGGYSKTCSLTIEYYPSGTFKGSASVNGNNFGIVLAIGTKNNGLVAVRLANSDAVATGISYNVSTRKVTITTTGSYSSLSYGNITGTYDPTSNKIKNVSCSGGIKNYVSNNGSITCTGANTSSTSAFYDCDGTTAQLQSTFKRRYMSGSWQVDNSNADRITSNTTEYVSGSGAVKRRGYSSGAVALNFNSDWSPAKQIQNVHFWVYNPSSSDITLRMWYYQAINFGSNGETGSVVAKAGQWTYLAMGFGSGSGDGNRTVYNFQISDWTNSGAYLTFDNIYLFNGE